MIRAALLIAALAAASAAEYDLVIRNARVVDGTGAPWYRADVAVSGGRIAAVGRLGATGAKREIDAAGRVAAPGFIDVHTHVEGSVERFPRGDNYVMDGVTTIVTGNCGGSFLDIAGRFAALEKLPLGLNVASLIGHNTVRREVMGTAHRYATPEEIGRMQALVEKAMREGAVGFSTGLIYIPGTYSASEEVIALAQAAARHGGVYASHMRDEGDRIVDAIAEAADVGRASGLPVQLSHFKIDTPRIWGSSVHTIALVESMRRGGLDIMVDQYPYDHSSTNLGITLPSWALADGQAQVQARLKDPATRARIVAEMLARLQALGHKDYSYATIAGFAADRSLEGRTISDVNRGRGRPGTAAAEAETILDILERGGAQMVYHSMSLDDVERILQYPNTAIASDGGIVEFGRGVPHPRAYGTNARVLAEFVRRRGTLTLEDAVRRMTSLPARTFAFRDRGLLRPGFAADIVIFDPARVEDKATYPAPHQYTDGFEYVVVNGAVMVDRGKLTEARGGRLLRRSSPQ